MLKSTIYKAKQFNLSGLEGISDKTLQMHFSYEGYVKGVNDLNEKIAKVLADGRVDQEETPGYSELKRRLGFEYSGMVLHEYYFENLKSGGSGNPDKAFVGAAETTFGSFEMWKTDFVGVGKMRGVGWAVCYQDPGSKAISNHWITLHEDGNISGFRPILVMDLWEHAYLLDYAPADRPKYVDAFMANIDWNSVKKRLDQAVIKKPAA